jgi:hypothetical protein
VPIPRSRRAAAISAAVRSRLNSRIGTPRYTTLTFDAGTLRTPTTKSAVVLDTASAMSVTGASSRSATF